MVIICIPLADGYIILFRSPNQEKSLFVNACSFHICCHSDKKKKVWIFEAFSYLVDKAVFNRGHLLLLFQLLNDYDKVKTVSSGSDCVCRCVVRPIKRSECSRIGERDSPSLSQDFYSVETITKGTDCKKCECMAPPSAVNPCEGEYRFKKLQEASKDDIKVETVVDLFCLKRDFCMVVFFCFHDFLCPASWLPSLTCWKALFMGLTCWSSTLSPPNCWLEWTTWRR